MRESEREQSSYTWPTPPPARGRERESTRSRSVSRSRHPHLSRAHVLPVARDPAAAECCCSVALAEGGVPSSARDVTPASRSLGSLHLARHEDWTKRCRPLIRNSARFACINSRVRVYMCACAGCRPSHAYTLSVVLFRPMSWPWLGQTWGSLCAARTSGW